jgi:hypothetical protein
MYWWCLGISAAVAFVVWGGFGPAWMSGPTFGWMSAGVLALFAVSLLAMRAGRPTRSVAHVLYEAEQQQRPGR